MASAASWSRKRRRFARPVSGSVIGLALGDRMLARVLDGNGRLRRQTLGSPALELAEATDRWIEERDCLAAVRARERAAAAARSEPAGRRSRQSRSSPSSKHTADRARGLDHRLEDHRQEGAPVVGGGESASDELDRLGVLALPTLPDAAAEDWHERLGEEHEREQSGDRRQRDVPVSLLRRRRQAWPRAARRRDGRLPRAAPSRWRDRSSGRARPSVSRRLGRRGPSLVRARQLRRGRPALRAVPCPFADRWS